MVEFVKYADDVNKEETDEMKKVQDLLVQEQEKGSKNGCEIPSVPAAPAKPAE